MDSQKTDILVIGGGAAGARAALEAAKAGARVLLATKGIFGRSGTSSYHVSDAAGFGASGFCDPGDGADIHFADIERAGLGMEDTKLAMTVAVEAQREFLQLRALGVPFVRDGNGYLATKSCFSSRPRSIKIRGHGYPLVQALRRECLAAGVEIAEKTQAIDPLLRGDGSCGGAMVMDGTGALRKVEAKAVILATGGAGWVFPRTLNPPDVTGDGYAFGLRAGCRLVNMEFMQAGFGLAGKRKSGIFQYWLWGLSPSLTTADGRDFFSGRLPKRLSPADAVSLKATHYPFSTRDDSAFLEIALQRYHNECADAGVDGTVNLAVDHIEERISALPASHNLRKMWPISKAFCRQCGIDFSAPIPIACYAHAMNGGLVIDEFGQTDVPGLYAAGETAGGPHGADRLGGNMFPTGQVFAARAARHAVQRSPTASRARAVQNPLPAGKAGASESLAALEGELRAAAGRRLLIIREARGLKDFLNTASRIGERLARLRPATRAEALRLPEVAAMLVAARSMAESALTRSETRGSHYREDRPALGKKHGQPLFISLGLDGELRCERGQWR